MFACVSKLATKYDPVSGSLSSHVSFIKSIRNATSADSVTS